MKRTARGENIAFAYPSQIIASLATLTPPGADRLPFWDQSAGAMAWLTPGSGVLISGTTLSVAGGFPPQLGFLKW